MGLRLTKDDFTTIFHYLGILITAMAIPLGLSLVLAVVYDEQTEICDFLFTIGVMLSVGEGMRLVTRDHGELTSRQAMLLVGFAWIVMLFLGAIPFAISGHYASYLDAVFEVCSGLTTTGLSLAQDLEHMPISLNSWRFLLQFVGGQGIVVAAISLGIFGRNSNASMAMAMYNSEGRSDQILPTVKQTSRFIWLISIIIVGSGTILGGILIGFAGQRFDLATIQSFWLSVAAFDTGGFAPYTSSLIFYHSYPLEILITVIGFLGIINFTLFAVLNRGNYREIWDDVEMRTIFIWITAITILCVGSLVSSGAFRPLPALLRRGVFMVLAAATNTGFSVLYPSQMTSLMVSGALFAIVLAMTVGGSTGSTSGGIKALRLDIIVRSIGHHIKLAVMPDSSVSDMKYNHIRKQSLTSGVISMAYTVTFLYILCYVLGTVIGIMLGYNAIPAMFESVSAASNTGLTSGLLTVGTPSVLKIVYIAEMIFGRFEFMTLLALITSLIMTAVPDRGRKARRDARRGGRLA